MIFNELVNMSFEGIYYSLFDDDDDYRVGWLIYLVRM